MTAPRDPQLEAALRASLAERAGRAPASAPLAERIVTALDRPPARDSRRRSWRTWALPLVAAGAVAASIAVVSALTSYRPHANPAPPAVTHLHRTPVPSPTAPPHSVQVPPPTAHVTAAPTASSGSTALHGVHVDDLSFVGPDDGWALASADCLSGPGVCSALLRTHDGTTWQGMAGTPFDVPEVTTPAGVTVSHIRFADDSIGYAYGPDALFMTTDGGSHWTRQKSLGADALETLNGTVILTRLAKTHCPDFCPLVERAPIGSTNWSAVHLPGTVPTANEQETLARSGHLAVLALMPADPQLPETLRQQATIYRSADDGLTWHRVGEPCPSIGTGYADATVAAAITADGSAVVLDCAVTNPAQPGFAGGSTITSTDGGRTFHAPVAGGKLGPATLLAATDAADQFVVAGGANNGPTALYRSTDGGDSWTQVPAIGTVGVSFIGFESATVGRVVADGGAQIWTTRDGGRSFTEVIMP